jgi:hypothetical protein
MWHRAGLAVVIAGLAVGCGKSGGGAGSQTATTTPHRAIYPSAVGAGYVSSCSQESGSTPAKCQCALQKLEARVPLSRFEADEQALIQRSTPLPPIYKQAIAGC